MHLYVKQNIHVPHIREMLDLDRPFRPAEYDLIQATPQLATYTDTLSNGYVLCARHTGVTGSRFNAEKLVRMEHFNGLSESGPELHRNAPEPG